jgi:hypothetical protein
VLGSAVGGWVSGRAVMARVGGETEPFGEGGWQDRRGGCGGRVV